jgi:methionine salvage enolase-phosphatase E1
MIIIEGFTEKNNKRIVYIKRFAAIATRTKISVYIFPLQSKKARENIFRCNLLLQLKIFISFFYFRAILKIEKCDHRVKIV